MSDKPIQANKAKIVWLASFPRSGNTLLRTILRHCFGQYSASIYKSDLGGNKDLETYVGHIEHDAHGGVLFPTNNIHLVKTHKYPQDDNPAIYVVRDGRAACMSMHKFYNDISLEIIIKGQNIFGTWADHLAAWKPWERPATLFLKYEDMITDLPAVLQKISDFLNLPIISEQIPDRTTIAGVDGKWVKKERKKEKVFPKEYIDLFNQFNGEMMQKLEYY